MGTVKDLMRCMDFNCRDCDLRLSVDDFTLLPSEPAALVRNNDEIWVHTRQCKRKVCGTTLHSCPALSLPSKKTRLPNSKNKAIGSHKHAPTEANEATGKQNVQTEDKAFLKARIQELEHQLMALANVYEEASERKMELATQQIATLQTQCANCTKQLAEKSSAYQREKKEKKLALKEVGILKKKVDILRNQAARCSFESETAAKRQPRVCASSPCQVVPLSGGQLPSMKQWHNFVHTEGLHVGDVVRYCLWLPDPWHGNALKSKPRVASVEKILTSGASLPAQVVLRHSTGAADCVELSQLLD